MSKTVPDIRPRYWYLLCLPAYLVLQIPFLFEGFGREFDAWSNALNARHLWETGQYEVSRLPGHPLYEGVLALLYGLQPEAWFLNALSLLAALACLDQVYRLARHWQLPYAAGIAFSMGLIPVFFLAGHYTIDYLPALWLILWSFRTSLKGKWWWAGLLLGLATGIRISSLAFLLPFIIYHAPRVKVKDAALLFLSSSLSAFVCYLPPLLTYGGAFLDFHKPPFPGWANIFYKLSLGIWGLALSLGLLVLFLRYGRRFLQKKAKTPIHSGRFILFVGSILTLQALVFFRLPFKSEFFLPALPFLWLAFFLYWPRRSHPFLLALPLVSLFSFGLDYANPYRGSAPGNQAWTFSAQGKALFLDPWQGPALLDLKKRAHKSHTVEQSLNILAEMKEPAWLVAGWYWPEIVYKGPPSRHVIDHYSTKAELDSAFAMGWTIYYLPEIGKQNEIMEGHYLADSLGQALLRP